MLPESLFEKYTLLPSAVYTITQLVCGDYLDEQLKATSDNREVLWSNAKSEFSPYAQTIEDLQDVMRIARRRREEMSSDIIVFGLVEDVIARRLLSDITLVRAKENSRFLEARKMLNEINISGQIIRKINALQVMGLVLTKKLELQKGNLS